MSDLLTYTDYRKYLHDQLEERKKRSPHLSLRHLAGRLGLDPGNLVKVLNFERHISQKVTENAVAYFGFQGKEAEYFRTLVAFGKAKKDAEINRLFNRLSAMQNVETFRMPAKMAEFYQSWYHSALCGLLTVIDFTDDYAMLARLLIPSITVSQARKSIALLKRLGVIDKDARGYLKPVHDLLTTGDKWHAAAIGEFQRQTIQLALKALDDLPKRERNISTVSFVVSGDDMAEIASLTADYRKSLLRIAENSTGADRVYQLNIQLFPLTKSAGGKS
ncbi:MAG: TIGR02147 family protein [Chitinivibrionales bacterium]|nr:TIGR02147 family protein [Chitinivibrionales bacterium]MBD3356466.1 TIGR02147 family protein [Chitinivibrionales bacterium]